VPSPRKTVPGFEKELNQKEALFPFRQLYRCQTMKEVALVSKCWRDNDSAGTIHETPYTVPHNLE